MATKDKAAPDREWLTLGEAADYLRMSKATFYRYLGEGKIPVYRLFGTGAPRFKKAELDTLFVKHVGPYMPVDDSGE